MKKFYLILIMALVISPFFGHSQNIINTIPSPTSSPNDIAFDGENIWVCGYNQYVLYKISPVDGTVIKTDSIPYQYPSGLVFDGQNLWLGETINSAIHKIDTSNGNILQSFTSPGSFSQGITWDGEYLWNNDLGGPFCSNLADSVFKLDINGNIINRNSAPSSCPTGLVFDGLYMWSIDSDNEVINKYDTATFSILETIPVPGGPYPNGLTFDGIYLWLVNGSSDQIYQIDVGYALEVKDENPSQGKISVFPNPSTGVFTFQGDIIQKSKSIQIYDISGKQILNRKPTNSITQEIDLSYLSSGVYFYSVIPSEGKAINGKLIKK